jgi:large subunit ribosomal protein L10
VDLKVPSEKILAKKKNIVSELSEKIKNAKTIVFADYRGLTVEQDTELRNALRKAGVDYGVVKNTLTKLAADENGLSELAPHFNGPTSMAISNDDVVAPAKILAEYSKKYEKLQIKAGVVEGKIFDESSIKALAALPPKEEMLAKALGSMKAPITGFVNVLNGNIRGLVVALNAIAEKQANA